MNFKKSKDQNAHNVMMQMGDGILGQNLGYNTKTPCNIANHGYTITHAHPVYIQR